MSLCIQNLTLRHSHDKTLLSDFTMTVNNGDVLTIMGPSGCGKSTLLAVIAGHLGNDFRYHGRITLNGIALDHLPAHQRAVGILFQDDLLFPHLTIWENLAFALPNAIKGKERQTHAMAALAALSLTELAHQYPEQLSGGQRARISLVRMLLAKPKVALLDEPFSKLDKALRTVFRDWVFEQLKQANIPTVLVTHDDDDIPVGSQVVTWTSEVTHA